MAIGVQSTTPNCPEKTVGQPQFEYGRLEIVKMSSFNQILIESSGQYVQIRTQENG